MNKNILELLAALDNSLIENHRHDTRLFAELNKSQTELGIVSDGRPFAPFLRPQLFSRQMYREIAHASEVLSGAFDAMTMAALEDDEVLAELGLTETEERYARIDPGYPGVCNSSRLDAFIADRSFKFLEYNGETPAGITDQLQIEKVLKKIPEVASFFDGHRHWMPRPHVKLLDALVSSYRDFGGTKEKPNIAIVDWDGVSTYTEFETLQEYFELRGHHTVIADPGLLEYDNETLRIGGFEVDIFYKRVLIHEFFDRSADDHPLLQAYRDGKVCMANSFRSKIPHKKASLAVLGNDRFSHLFTDEQLEMIRKHLPWTRLITDRQTKYKGEMVELLDFVRRERSRFILKPNDDYGGSGIVIGWESTEAEWDAAIEHALTVPYVVQERVPVQKVQFPTYDTEAKMEELLIDFDPFLFRGKVEGGLVRLSSQSLVNVAAGGGEAAMVVLEDH
ncbi:MAG: hypothetical protein ABIV48_09635 [Pyrinomonadaceae bacterium]